VWGLVGVSLSGDSLGCLEQCPGAFDGLLQFAYGSLITGGAGLLEIGLLLGQCVGERVRGGLRAGSLGGIVAVPRVLLRLAHRILDLLESRFQSRTLAAR